MTLLRGKTGRAFQSGLVLAAVCLLLGGHGTAADADYRIAVASDPHYIAPSLTDGGAYYQRVLDSGDSKFMPYSEEILSAFLDEVLEEKPDAVLLTGDLTFNGAVTSHEALIGKLRILKDAGIPVLVTTGNHDVYNINAAQYHGDGFTRVPFAATELFDELYRDFGLADALSTDGDSLSYVYPLNDGTRVLVLDLNTIHDYCGISENTLQWMEEQLKAAEEAGVSVLAAGHQNLFQHTVFYDGYVIDKAERVAALLRKYHVPLYLSGHLHVQHIQTEDGLTEIASSALCSYPCQYGMLKAENGELSYETKRLDMAAWAEAHGRRDEPVFQDFAASAAEYMIAHFKAAPPAGTDESEWPNALDYLQKINLAYFAGDLRKAADLDPDGHLAELWLTENDLTSLYVASVLKDLGRDFTRWTGELQGK